MVGQRQSYSPGLCPSCYSQILLEGACLNMMPVGHNYVINEPKTFEPNAEFLRRRTICMQHGLRLTE